MKNKTAIYCRLSREDEKNIVSSSIINQEMLLREYIKKHNFSLYKVYTDDGYSGGNFNRPGFKRMIDDINDKKIDIVLVKDLSRLGRNYLEVGYYTEEFFPSKQIRFIAVNDNYDSFQGEDDITPFKNIINQWYLKDISNKVKAVHEARMKKGNLPKGKFIPLFGYQYNESNERVIDPTSSMVVKKVFELYNQGYSTNKIKEELIKHRMTTPSFYNYTKYCYNSEYWRFVSEDKKYDWSSQVINRIISNIEYTGTLELKKRQTISYKTHQRKVSSDEEKYVFNNRFPAIIDIGTYNKALQIRKGKTHSKKYENDCLHNLVFCTKCHKALSIIKSNNIKYLVCRRKGCKTRINYNTLLEILEKEVKKYYYDLIKNTNIQEKFNRYYYHNLNDIKDLELRNNRIEELIYKLHQEYLENNISKNIFDKLITNYQQELLDNNSLLAAKKEVNEFKNFEVFLKNELGINQLIKIFIDKVLIKGEKKIKNLIIFYYKSDYECNIR